MELVSTLTQGVLLGALYALCAVPLAISFGVMRIVNIATGDFIILGAFIALLCERVLGLPLPVAGAITLILMSGIGYAVQAGLLNRTFDAEMIRPLLATLGLSIIFQNGLVSLASGDSRKIVAGPIETASFDIAPGLVVGVFPVITAVVAGLVILSLWLLMRKTRFGLMLRATSDDPATVGLFGVDQRRVFIGAMVLATAIAGIAGLLLGVRTQFTPFSGSDRLIYAFEVVILGGLGSIPGTLIGGVMLGIAQTVGAYSHPSLQIIAGHVLFVTVLVFRPNGLFGRAGRH
jgi:branched-chain amino acid transport system permease protein